MVNIGIVGKGFVGTAVANGMSPGVGFESNVWVYDKEPSKSVNTLDEVINNGDFIFVSVPTPSNKDGSINLEILKQCIAEISDAKNEESNPVILIRSTILPGTSRQLQKQFPKLRIVFNPEFLTERSANFDFISQSRFILGGEKSNTSPVRDLFKKRFGESLSIIETDYETAEFIKYVCNIFFACKVSFLNEMKLISDNIGANWEQVIDGFVRDGRVGHSHTNVPGHDGKYGFGGSCFPKDIQALINFAELRDIDLNVVRGAWETNLNVRPEKDWELLKGRAIVDE